MKKIIRLTESDLTRIVRRVINEYDDGFEYDKTRFTGREEDDRFPKTKTIYIKRELFPDHYDDELIRKYLERQKKLVSGYYSRNNKPTPEFIVKFIDDYDDDY